MDSRLAIDTGVLLLYFVVIIFIGLRMGRKEDNLEDFALGGRRIPWWAVLASLVAAETSAGTFFGTPGEGFSHRNYTYLQLAFGTIIGRILVSYIFIKPYYDYKVFSIYEYLTARFGVASKNAASAVFMITRLLASGARLYVAAIALALAYEMISGARPEPDSNSLDLRRRHSCHRHSDGDLHHARRNQGRHLDRFDSGLDHDWQRARSRSACSIPPFQAAGTKSCNATAPFKVSDLIATGLDPARHGWDKVKGHVRDRVHDLRRLDRLDLHHHGHARHRSGHGAANVDRARYSPQPPLAHSLRPRRHPDRVHVSQHRIAALGLLSGPSRSDAAEDARTKPSATSFSIEMPVGLRGLLLAGIFATAMGSLSTALERARHQFHARLVRALHQSRRDRRAKLARRALGDRLVFRSDDRRRIDHGVSRHRASQRPHYSDRAWAFSATPTARCSAFFLPEC